MEQNNVILITPKPKDETLVSISRKMTEDLEVIRKAYKTDEDLINELTKPLQDVMDIDRI